MDDTCLRGSLLGGSEFPSVEALVDGLAGRDWKGGRDGTRVSERELAWVGVRMG